MTPCLSLNIFMVAPYRDQRTTRTEYDHAVLLLLQMLFKKEAVAKFYLILQQ